MSEQLNEWIGSSDVLTLFPTLVWKLQLKAAMQKGMNERLLTLIETLRPDAARLEPGMGWQYAHNLHEQEALGELVSCIEGAITFSIIVRRFESARFFTPH